MKNLFEREREINDVILGFWKVMFVKRFIFFWQDFIRAEGVKCYYYCNYWED